MLPLRTEAASLALTAPVASGLARCQTLGPDFARVRERLPSLFQHRGIRDRLALARRGRSAGLRQRARWPAPPTATRASQPIESDANLSQLRMQLLVLGRQLPILPLEGFIRRHDLGDLVHYGARANSPGAPAPS